MLAAGTRFGPYEIMSPLGKGGMGEVYRARDTRLDRQVAIKVVSGGRANDAQFRERFEREARAISSLNHPNICVLHDVGSEGDIAYLVMERLEGESLAERLERGPLAVGEALRYAIEIASALDAAHRRGVVHRDLKPGNVMLTKTGAKLLDFGLAKVRSPGATAAETVTLAMTTEGSLVGTFQYMSPEQLEGQEADARSDIFAFGATLYEMITGKRAFEGKSQASLIAAILKGQPAAASSVQAAVPASLERVVGMCLAKAPDERWQSARDLENELRWIQESGGPPSAAAAAAKPGAKTPWIAATIGVLAAAAMAVLLLRQEKPAPPRVIQFSVTPPEGATLGPDAVPQISPDGEWIIFPASAGGDTQLYLHSLSNGSTRALPDTSNEPGPRSVWSFDSRSFLTRLKSGNWVRMETNGGPGQSTQFQHSLGYYSWGPAGVVGAVGAEVRFWAPDGSGGRTLKSLPEGTLNIASWLPGGRWLVYNNAPNSAATAPVTVHALSLDGKEDRILTRSTGQAIYAEPGYLLFLRGSLLMAQAFDGKRLEIHGSPTPLVDHIGATNQVALGAYSVSANGVLAFRPGDDLSKSQLVWTDRSGHPLGTVGAPADYSNPALSPDGRRLAVAIRDVSTRTRDIWVFDLVRNTSSRLTFDPGDDTNPTWSPDGSRIAFTSDRRGLRALYVKSASGTGDDELLVENNAGINVEDWSRDGRWLAFNRGIPSRGISVFSLESRKAESFLDGELTVDQARFSPDGHWLAYRSLENGQPEIYVRPFRPGTAGGSNGSGSKWQISARSGSEPLWRGDGKELFFSSDGKIMAVDIGEEKGALVAGIPHELFSIRVGPLLRNRWLATPDGKKFLAVQLPEPKLRTSFTVIVNWPSLLKK